jgi:MYXO-CTERM domain-containing protein
MVVPVPVVLQEENVKTLPKEIFARVDKLAAPRLVEYWETDPCYVEPPPKDYAAKPSTVQESAPAGVENKDGVTIEAQFKVGEYEIVILSAKDSTGLERWLKSEKYAIPKGAGPYLEPYVKGGSKFFVAKVDTKKVKFKDGMAMLSPLRFHYDSEEFSLPVRLGLMSSAGTQDLIVHILARGQRYEVANYKNVTIPTNIDLTEEAKARFGEFYAALFDATLEKNPNSVITEYSWDSGSCDPCPEPPLQQAELATLGADVLEGGQGNYYSMVLTRVHARYSKEALGEDLVFKAAKPISGGREVRSGPNGTLEQGSSESGMNNFQGRYAIRHEWKGKIECKDPVRGRWGGPPAGEQASSPTAATDLAFAPRGSIKLGKVVASNIPEIGVSAEAAAAGATGAGAADEKPATGTTQPATGDPKKAKKGCGCAVVDGRSAVGTGLLLFVAIFLAGLRRRRR